MFILIGLLLLVVLILFAFVMYQRIVFPKRIEQTLSHIEEGKYKEARSTLDSLPKSRMEDSIVKWCDAQINIGQGQYVLAMVALQDIIKKRQYNFGLKEFQVHEALAHVYQQTGRLKDAAMELQFVIHLLPNNFNANFQLGKMYLSQKLFSQAKEYLERAVEASPKNPKALFMLGEIYYHYKDARAATLAFERTIANDHTYYDAYLYLGRIAYELKDYANAQANFAAAKAKKDLYDEAVTYEAFACYHLGDYEQAAMLFNDALMHLSPNDSQYLDVVELLSDTNMKLKRVSDLKTLWERAFKEHPTYRAAGERLELFNHVFADSRLSNFFSLSVENFQTFVKKFFETNRLYVDTIDVRNENEIIGTCEKMKTMQARTRIIVIFNRKPQRLSVETLREYFLMIKNRHATQGYVITPFEFTEECYHFITSRPIELVDGERFIKVLNGEEIF